jgi:hypothetical protein
MQGTRDRLGVPDMGSPKAAKESPGGANAGSQVVSKTPAGWLELPANPARFRNAVWQVSGQPESDCYLTLGVGGGVDGNLRRWYESQFGMSSTPAREALAPIDFMGRQGRLAELEGTFAGKPNWGALIAFFSEGDRVTSLKFTGPIAVVKGNRKQFLALAQSVRTASASPNASAPPIEPGQQMPPGHVPVNGGTNASPNPAPSPFTASIPAGWSAKAGSRRMLHHTAGKGTEVYVSQLGGTLRQTLDIWRGEVSVGGRPLGPLTDEEFKSLPRALFLGDDALVMDLAGDFAGMAGSKIANARLLVAARLDGTTITFCKLVGPQDEVAAQRSAFEQFCVSIRRTK